MRACEQASNAQPHIQLAIQPCRHNLWVIHMQLALPSRSKCGRAVMSNSVLAVNSALFPPVLLCPAQGDISGLSRPSSLEVLKTSEQPQKTIPSKSCTSSCWRKEQCFTAVRTPIHWPCRLPIPVKAAPTASASAGIVCSSGSCSHQS